jgi:hypothetical protein
VGREAHSQPVLLRSSFCSGAAGATHLPFAAWVRVVFSGTLPLDALSNLFRAVLRLFGRPSQGRPLALDPRAPSASPPQPAFISRPDSAPVYHGFRILEDVVEEGFTFGMITDFELQPAVEGDAFVVAPDGSRAGLVWTKSDEATFVQLCEIESDRWGVWAVSFPHPMDSRENVRRNLRLVLPKLKEQWDKWRKEFG